MSKQIKDLSDKIKSLEDNIGDLEISLTTAVEHGDFIEDQLSENNDFLLQQIDQRISAETTLKKLVHLITQQKDDLEILVDTVVQHSDSLDFEWLKKIVLVEQDSLTDALTNIANRRAFDEYYFSEWRRAIKHKTSFGLIIFDIDYFKHYNDINGHSQGDKCLINVAQLVSECIKHPAHLLARYGGEEFAIVLPNTDKSEAKKIAHELLLAVEQGNIMHSKSDISDYVTVSVGVNCYKPSSDSNALEFLDSVDKLLYKAKDLGRNRVVSFSDRLNLPKVFPKVATYGDYQSLHVYQKLESLSLSFIPSSIPISQRWRNNGLSADFLADYITTFFPTSDDPKTEKQQSEIKSAVGFIANELLENVMKYTDPTCTLTSGINLYLDKHSFIFESYNYIDEKAKYNFIKFISKIQNHDPYELFIKQIEDNAENNQSAGLGYLTMINDYNAKASWKFLITNKDHIKAHTQIRIDI